jgi:cell division protein FtsW (lipid II flippase)
MMVIFGGTFVAGDKQLDHLAGFLVFSLASFGCLYLGEKRSKNKINGQTLTNKIFFALIGGAIFALLLVYINVNFGRLWAIAYFSISSCVLYEINRRFIKENKASIKEEA